MFSVKSNIRTISILSVGITCFASYSFAARPIDLSKEPLHLTQPHSLTASAVSNPIDVISSHTDENQVTHVRVQQKYLGYSVWGGDAVVHLPKTVNRNSMSMNSSSLIQTLNSNPLVPKNGIFYADLNKDLGSVAPKSFNDDTAKTAAIHFYQQTFSEGDHSWSLTQEKANPIVYVDDANKAHFAYVVTFLATKSHERPQRPTAIIDAENHAIYKQWDDIRTSHVNLNREDAVPGTAIGYGGNPLLGQWLYGKDKPALPITRSEAKQLCLLRNDQVEVRKYVSFDDQLGQDISFTCAKPLTSASDYQEPNNGYLEQFNEAYSPVNDALYYGMIIKQLYQDWYGIPVLTANHITPMLLSMNVLYADYENAFWDPEQEKMYFGSGSANYYPFVSLGIAAHEVSHGFTAQHSNLAYMDQSGALNESFSDMAAAAASYYESGQKETDWTLGWEIIKSNLGNNKDDMQAIRHFDQPKKDGVSIDDVKQYEALNQFCARYKDQKQSCIVHLASGVFNKAFYVLATTPGWNTKSAFAVMIKANQDYWTSTSTYQSAACGVKKAAVALNKNPKDIEHAFQAVGISLGACA